MRVIQDGHDASGEPGIFGILALGHHARLYGAGQLNDFALIAHDFKPTVDFLIPLVGQLEAGRLGIFLGVSLTSMAAEERSPGRVFQHTGDALQLAQERRCRLVTPRRQAGDVVQRPQQGLKGVLQFHTVERVINALGEILEVRLVLGIEQVQFFKGRNDIPDLKFQVSRGLFIPGLATAHAHQLVVVLEQVVQQLERLQCPLGFIGHVHLPGHDLGFQPQGQHQH